MARICKSPSYNLFTGIHYQTWHAHCLIFPAGLDYRANTTTLTFSVSMPTQVVTIPILDDLVVENRESFTVALATNDRTVTLRFQTGCTVSIVDNDSKLQLCSVQESYSVLSLEVFLIVTWTPFSGVTIGFNRRTYSVIEGAGRVSVTVSVLNGTLARRVRVGMYTSSNTASSRSGKSWFVC